MQLRARHKLLVVVRIAALGLMGFLVLPTSPAFGQQTYRVDQSATGSGNGLTWDDAFVFLQDALGQAVSGDEIWVAAGTHHPDEGIGQVPSDRDATFQLVDGVALYGGFAGTESQLSQRDFETNQSVLSGDLMANDTVISCSADLQCAGAGERCWNGACIRRTMIDDNSYTVVAADGVSSATLLDGFTITGGHANGPPTGTEPVRERHGAGMYVQFVDAPTAIPSEPVIRNCRFEWNTAAEWGGAIFVQAPPDVPDGPHIQSCSFFRNSSFKEGSLALPLGGAVCSFDTDTRVDECTFIENVAAGGFGGAGGAIGTQNIAVNLALGRFPAMRINRCVFIDNLTDGLGGAMYDSHNDTIFTNCRFDGNRAGSGGGYASVGGTPTVVNSIFVGNTAIETSQIISSSSGGGLAMPASDQKQEATIVNCLFVDNHAADMGGGIYWRPLADPAGVRRIANNIVRGNTADGSGDQIAVDGSAELAPKVTFCNIEAGWTNVDCPAGFPACNIDADPMFADAPVGDYALEPNSPCIDAGGNDIVLSLAVLTDIAGDPRRQDDCDVVDTGSGTAPIVDIGPHESPSTCGEPIPIVSEWGMIVLALLILSAGTLVYSQWRRTLRVR